jgi:hypothetical protein
LLHKAVERAAAVAVDVVIDLQQERSLVGGLVETHVVADVERAGVEPAEQAEGVRRPQRELGVVVDPVPAARAVGPGEPHACPDRPPGVEDQRVALLYLDVSVDGTVALGDLDGARLFEMP